MNKVILCGRLTKDPEIRITQDGLTIARYTLAVDDIQKDDKGNYLANFIQCVAFGKSGEFASKYMYKGRKFLVCGRWKTGSYKNRDGNTVYTNECFVEQQEFADSKNEQQDSSSGQSSSQANQPEIPQTDDFMDIPDGYEGLPFE